MTADEGSARQTLSVADLEAWVRRSAELISEHAEELTELDAAIGDADHGTNMKRGLAAAVDAVGAGGFTVADALLKKVGTTARRDMERFFEKKIFLELYVKVEPDWRNRDNLLRRFGYKLD